MDRFRNRARWWNTAAAAILMVGGASAASAVSVVKGVGMVAGNDLNDPYTYVIGGDGNLWVNTFKSGLCPNPQNGAWCSLGTPPGVSLEIPVGTALDGSNEPLAFVTGSDGNLWMEQYYKGSWIWVNCGRPPTANLVMGSGAVKNGTGNPMAFVVGSDNNLWQAYYSGGWSWHNLGNPGGVTFSSTSGAVTNSGGNPEVFLVASNGPTWQALWNGSNWAWSNRGGLAPEGFGTKGAAALSNGEAMFFVVGTDENAYEDLYNGGWNWSAALYPVTMPVGVDDNGQAFWFDGQTLIVSNAPDSAYVDYCIGNGVTCQTPQFPIGATAAHPSGPGNGPQNFATIVDTTGNVWLTDDYPNQQIGKQYGWTPLYTP